jgi:hypothetical protein
MKFDKPRVARIHQCNRCPDPYLMAGDVPIRLAEYRRPHIDPITGRPYSGTCPKHVRRDLP